MKLMLVGYLHGYGGAEKMLIKLANETANRGYDVILVGLAQNNPCYKISPSVKYVFLNDIGTNRISKIIHRYKSLKNEIISINPDLIINFNLQSANFCALMGKGIPDKTIYCERGDPYDREYDGLLGLIRLYTFKNIRGFVFQTHGAQSCFNSSVASRSAIIHNPVTVNNVYCADNLRRNVIVTVGRLSEQKNQKLLIEAYDELPDNIKNKYTVEIYGEGPLRNYLQDTIDNMGLHNRVELVGVFPNVCERINDATLFVLTSDYEGMPNALLEAMALGLPCISTDCRPGGAREIIKDGINGIIVPCGDKRLLSNAINSMLSNEKFMKEISLKAREVIDDYSETKIFDKWEDFFSKMIEN